MPKVAAEPRFRSDVSLVWSSRAVRGEPIRVKVIQQASGATRGHTVEDGLG